MACPVWLAGWLAVCLAGLLAGWRLRSAAPDPRLGDTGSVGGTRSPLGGHGCCRRHPIPSWGARGLSAAPDPPLGGHGFCRCVCWAPPPRRTRNGGSLRRPASAGTAAHDACRSRSVWALSLPARCSPCSISAPSSPAWDDCCTTVVERGRRAGKTGKGEKQHYCSPSPVPQLIAQGVSEKAR